MKKIVAFTLAEVLITLAIIGVVAALTIPSVIANTQQQEFKTGLKKAVSVLNSSITMNMAIDGESPYDNQNLFEYLQRHMSVMKSTTNIISWFWSTSRISEYNEDGSVEHGYVYKNASFYTTDGTRYEFINGHGEKSAVKFPLYETEGVYACGSSTTSTNIDLEGHCHGCGSLGLASNPDDTRKPPCIVIVDVNGDRKPSPYNVACRNKTCAEKNFYKYADAAGKRLSDIFPIMITDKQAIPYGTAAQKAMYNTQK